MCHKRELRRVFLTLPHLNAGLGFGTYETEIARRLSCFNDMNVSSLYFSVFGNEHERVNFPVERIRIPAGCIFSRKYIKNPWSTKSIFKKLFSFYLALTSYDRLCGGGGLVMFTYFLQTVCRK